MIDLEALYTGIGDALREVDGLRVADLAADMPPPPVAVVLPPSLTLADDPNLSWCWTVGTVPILLMVGRPTERQARANLTTWLPLVIDALGKDSTFGGAVGDSTVTAAEPRNEQDYPGYVVSVRVYIPK